MIDLILGVHLLSHHVEAKPWQENFNPGLYVRTTEGWTAGFYRNTLRRTSVYLGRTVALTSWADITLGGVTGYESRPAPCWSPELTDCRLGLGSAKVKPLIAPSVHLGPARVSWVPGTAGSANVLHLSLERKF